MDLNRIFNKSLDPIEVYRNRLKVIRDTRSDPMIRHDPKQPMSERLAVGLFAVACLVMNSVAASACDT